MKYAVYYLFLLLFLQCCTITGPSGIFGKKSPHEQYGLNLSSAGLENTALGRAWFSQAEQSLSKPLRIEVPYRESGYFPADRALATALRFEARQGEKITISLQKKPAINFTIYIDLWKDNNGKNKKLLAYADSSGNPFSHDIDESGTYILRLQPELLSAGEYTLTLTNGPSLAFPVKNGRLGSFWGADRDAGVRRHEGVDIFAPKRTPAVAAAPGVVNRVGENKLGGRVVFFRPEGKNYSLYYAHLDEQLVTEGQRVQLGDTLGLVGNTGNAAFTPSHLHFGIYTSGGAVDPLPFIDQTVRSPAKLSAPLGLLGKSVRTKQAKGNLRSGPGADEQLLSSLPAGSLMQVYAATSAWYKVLLPNGEYGFISSSSVNEVNTPVRQVKLAAGKPLLDKPDTAAARKTDLNAGEVVGVLGSFENYYFVEAKAGSGWIVRE